jgi:hypothetical protein
VTTVDESELSSRRVYYYNKSFVSIRGSTPSGLIHNYFSLDRLYVSFTGPGRPTLLQDQFLFSTIYLSRFILLCHFVLSLSVIVCM